MPCIWGSHNNSQIFLDVMVVAIDFDWQTVTPQSPIPRFKALLDTGAQKTGITSAAAAKMSLSPSGMVRVHGVAGEQKHNEYLFRVGLFLDGAIKVIDDKSLLSSPLSFLNKDIEGVEFNSSGGFDVLLGMDVISTGSLKVEGNGTFSFSF
ncbi:hypothetical protein [Candidatus Spongiihabitans sp.]|uniref:hypothetical protein n=1 Tax=Candidatus Spongiihabitans sp. TaxID=3101308 RepID=UPI003C7B503C